MNNRFAKSVLTNLYLLQLEEYSIARFLKCIKKRRFEPLEQFRKGIHWTAKLIAVSILSVVLQFFLITGAVIVVSELLNSVFSLIAVFALVLLFVLKAQHIFIILAVLVLLPIDRLVKRFIIHKARNAIKQVPHMTIIGITGSYGKTTMKEILKTLLEFHFRVLATPENVNTDIGVAKFVLHALRSDTQVLIVEMGAYGSGDIKRLCAIAPPDLSILTGINETHLERFEFIERIIQTKFEIVKHSKDNAYVVLNADNSYITEAYSPFIGPREVSFYSFVNHELASYQVQNKEFHSDGSGWSFELLAEGERFSLSVPFLGEYGIGMVMGAICAARRLGMNMEKIRAAIQRLQPVLHRLHPLRTQDVFVIDDGYNGNIEGVKEAIQTLKNISGKRKIYITPGLVETGVETERIHLEVGERLAGTVDHVVLVRNSVTHFIAQGLEQSGFHAERIHWFSDFKQVQAGLKLLIQPGDVLLFQNDWPENYS